MHKIDLSAHKPVRPGFTLAEVLITIVILGVVAGLAVPTYFQQMEQTRSNEATVNLNAIYMGQKIYAMNNGGNFWNAGNNPTAASINAALNIDINPQFYDIISINANNGATPRTFSAVARRNTTQGGDGATQFTINQNGTITSP